MPPLSRRTVVGVVFLALATLTGLILFDVLGTVFFAITVAYVLLPVRRRLADHGLSARMASTLATLLAFVAVLALFSPIVAVLYLRRTSLMGLISDLPESMTLVAFGYRYVLEAGTVYDRLGAGVADFALDVASAAPVLALKLMVFVFLVFGLLLRPAELRAGLLGPLPQTYHDVAVALHERARSTLFAIYVLQAATAAGTFLVAYAVFWALGYDGAFTLAVVAGVLQFIPILGPSVLVLLLGAYQLVHGSVTAAVVVVVLGLVLVGFLPDAVIRTRLARRTTHLPTSLYFIGFVGGVLTVGAVGFIAGPLVVALLAEAMDLLSAEGAAGSAR